MTLSPTEKQKCIAEQAVYGLKLAYIDAIITAKGYDTADNVVGVLYWNDEGVKETAFERDCIPILRPLSDLAKEITHRGYNEDKPFVPSHKIDILESSCGWSIHMPPSTLRPRRHIAENDLLHLWHFDTRNLIEKGDAINVNTLDINPYSVKL